MCELTLDDVVGSAIGCSSETVRRAISEHLEDANADEEDFYWPGQEYCRTPSPFESADQERWYAVGPWHHVAYELVHGRRFFNDNARSFFEWLIGEALEAEDPERPGTPALVTTLDIGTDFYRSRIASGEKEARTFAENPAVALGSAPKERAANNRMSPAGVPLLYVSREVETCIAEVRPSIGDTVVVGRFRSTAQLKFFDFTMLSRRLVRNSGSAHELAIAKLYCQFVRNSAVPKDVPLLIPELRYGGKDVKHEHRLDFTVIDPYTLSKVGFELSPWSTHGLLSGTKGKTQKAINEEAQANFEREMSKLKAYFRKRGIPVIVYTDKDLQDHAKIFTDIEDYLTPAKVPKQLEFHALEDFLAFKSPK